MIGRPARGRRLVRTMGSMIGRMAGQPGALLETCSRMHICPREAQLPLPQPNGRMADFRTRCDVRSLNPLCAGTLSRESLPQPERRQTRPGVAALEEPCPGLTSVLRQMTTPVSGQLDFQAAGTAPVVHHDGQAVAGVRLRPRHGGTAGPDGEEELAADLVAVASGRDAPPQLADRAGVRDAARDGGERVPGLRHAPLSPPSGASGPTGRAYTFKQRRPTTRAGR